MKDCHLCRVFFSGSRPNMARIVAEFSGGYRIIRFVDATDPESVAQALEYIAEDVRTLPGRVAGDREQDAIDEREAASYGVDLEGRPLA